MLFEGDVIKEARLAAVKLFGLPCRRRVDVKPHNIGHSPLSHVIALVFNNNPPGTACLIPTLLKIQENLRTQFYLAWTCASRHALLC